VLPVKRAAVLLAAMCLAAFATVASAQVPVDVLHTFVPGEPAFPSALVAGPDGTVYGSSERGGFFDGGNTFSSSGTVFRVAPDGGLTVLRSFDEHLSRPRALVFSAGALFGLAQSPTAPRGAVFGMNPDGSLLRIVHVFSDATGGGNAGGTLVSGADGLLYGVSPDLASGRIYRLDPSTGTFTVLHLFDGTDGHVTHSSPMIAAADGNLYGIAGTVIYKLTPSGAFTVLKRFVCGTDVYCSPIALPGMIDGNLFVEMESAGGGAVARLPAGGGAATFFPLNSTTRWLGWILAGDGNFYAVQRTQILRLTPQGQVAIIRTLGAGEGTFGDLWTVPMILEPNGRILGATSTGGPHDRGRTFRFATDGTFAWLHSMTTSPEGAGQATLVHGPGGTLYGTARIGGAFDRGTAFSIAADGTFTVLHSFSGGEDGGRPLGITLASDGNLYGATQSGGTGNGGLLFRMSTTGTVTPVHAFVGSDASVRTPRNVPVQASDGALYGTTDAGIYRCTLDGTFTLVHAFDEFSIVPGDPSPIASVPMVELDGVLYGAVGSFDAIGDGLPPSNPFIFALTLGGQYRRVAVFDPSFSLTGALVAGHDGALYGTTADTFFRITPSGSRADLLSLPLSGLSGHSFTSTLIAAADGEFYCGFTPNVTTPKPGGVCRVTVVGGFSTISERLPDALVQEPDRAITGVNYRSGLRAEGPADIFRFPLPQLMALDFPSPGTTTSQPFPLSGWAIDRAASAGTGIDSVHVWAYPSGGGIPIFVGAASYGGARPDVGSIYGARFTNSGFAMMVSGLPPGIHTLVAYAHGSESRVFSQSRAAVVTIPASQPAMNIDIPGEGATVGRPFQVDGWAIDRGAPRGAGVDAIHVYAFAAGGGSTFLGVASTGLPRPDVGTAFGAQFTNSGFSLSTSASLAPGNYTLVVYARSVVSESWFWQTRSITVPTPGDPVMTIDTPGNGATAGQPFLLAGWAIDRDATSGTGVDTLHVWAFPTDGGPAMFVGAADTGGNRADVGAAYGSQFTNSGYNVSVSGLPPGQYQIVVYAHSTVTGTFNQSRVVTVVIQ
jgi:uncharacterized repeat protein (TIGR03803 family)